MISKRRKVSRSADSGVSRVGKTMAREIRKVLLLLVIIGLVVFADWTLWNTPLLGPGIHQEYRGGI